MLFADFFNLGIICGLSKQVNCNHCSWIELAFFFYLLDCFFQLNRVYIEGSFIYIHKYWCCTLKCNYLCTCKEGESRYKYSISCFDIPCHHNQSQCIGTVTAGNAVFYTNIFSQLLFQFCYLFAADKVTVFCYFQHCCIHLWLQNLILPF